MSLDNPVVSDIRQEWDWVRPGIEEILHIDRHLTFIPEDVYAACKSGQALLWTTEEGFVISTSETDPFNGEKTFLVWLAWARERGNSIALKHYDFFADSAKEAGFSKIEVRSNVPAMQEYLPANNWDVSTVVYTRDL